MRAACFLLGNSAFWLATLPLHLPAIAGGIVLTLVNVGVSYAICEIWVFRTSQ